MKKFVTLRAANLKLDDLAGLCSETLVLVEPHTESLGALGLAKYNALSSATATFEAQLSHSHKSPLTTQIEEVDKQRDASFSEIKRTAVTAAKSSIADTAYSGALLVEFLKPFWNINIEPLISQTTQIDILSERYNNNEGAQSAVIVLNLITVLTAFFAANNTIHNLYNQRLEQIAGAAGPSASSLKYAAVVAYDGLCNIVVQTLTSLPTITLQNLFVELNELRKKYIRNLPTPLDVVHTIVEPISVQTYIGRPITPLPRVHFKDVAGTVELFLGKDFNITYRNNINVGEADLFLHGKGKYTGQYGTTFHIARV